VGSSEAAIVAISRTVCGETALQSTYVNARGADLRAAATVSATRRASPGGTIESKRSPCATASPIVSTAAIPNAGRRRRLASLRPATETTTEQSASVSRFATAAPISPAPKIATALRCIYRLFAPCCANASASSGRQRASIAKPPVRRIE
jgi:hypothetical protein